VRLINLLANSLLLMIEDRDTPQDTPARSVPQTLVCPWCDGALEAPSLMVERVMNSIRNALGMRETEIAPEPIRPWNPHFYVVFAPVHITL
jgi:hypothetical protein